jgi:hypothetical protein
MYLNAPCDSLLWLVTIAVAFANMLRDHECNSWSAVPGHGMLARRATWLSRTIE